MWDKIKQKLTRTLRCAYCGKLLSSVWRWQEDAPHQMCFNCIMFRNEKGEWQVRVNNKSPEYINSLERDPNDWAWYDKTRREVLKYQSEWLGGQGCGFFGRSGYSGIGGGKDVT